MSPADRRRIATSFRRVLWLKCAPSVESVEEVAEIEFAEFRAYLTRHEAYLAPLLFWCLRRCGRHRLLQRDQVRFLERRYAFNMARNSILRRALCRIVREFSENQLDCILLKGAASFVEGRAEIGSVISPWDIDILVPPSSLPLAEEILRSLKYEYQRRQAVGGAEKVAYRSHDRIAFVDLHTSIFWESSSVALGAAAEQALRRRAQSVKLTGCELEVRTPSLEDEVLVLFLHDAVVRPLLTGSLARFYFFAHLLHFEGGRLDWQLLFSSLEKAGLRRLFLAYLILARKDMRLELPPGVGPLVERARRDSEYLDLARLAPAQLANMNHLLCGALCSNSSFHERFSRVYSKGIRRPIQVGSVQESHAFGRLLTAVKILLLLVAAACYLSLGNLYMRMIRR